MKGQLLHHVLQQKEEWGEIVADDWLPFGEFLIHWRKEMNSGNSMWRTINWNKHANIEAPSSNFMLLQVLHHLNLRSPLNPSKSGTHSYRMSKLLHLAHVQLLYSHMRLNGTQLCY